MNSTEYNHDSPATDDVDALARDADRRRDRIEQTLNVLGGKLSPEHMKDQAFDLFKEHGGDIASSLQRSAKNNPIPLLLTGVGIAWMMMSQRDDRQRGEYSRYDRDFRQPSMDTRYIPQRSAFSDEYSTDRTGYSSDRSEYSTDRSEYSSDRSGYAADRSDYSTDSSSDESLADKLGDAKDKVVEGASNTWDSVTGGARDARDATGERLDSMREQSAAKSRQLQQQYRSAAHQAGRTADEWANDASRFMREQPLVAGALGIALGALLGGLLPTSDKERQLARKAVNSDAGKAAVERSGEILDSAKHEASARIEQVGEAAKKKVDEVKESAQSDA